MENKAVEELRRIMSVINAFIVVKKMHLMDRKY